MRTQNHVRSDCKYHVVIVPKYRKKVLYSQVGKSVRELLRDLAKQKGIDILEGNVMPDHVHMVLSVPPKYSISSVIGFLKGKSAIRLHQLFGKSKSVMQKSFWSRGYFVRTIGLDESMVREYVKDQWKKDTFYEGSHLDLHWN